MDEKDRLIQLLRAENEALKKFQMWLRTEAFGEEQFKEIVNAFVTDPENRVS